MLKRDHILHDRRDRDKEEKYVKRPVLMRLLKSRNSRLLKSFSTALAAVVIFGTTYSLILPAITVDQESAEEMPGLYLEDEAFYGEEYENSFENAYDSDEVSYEQGMTPRIIRMVEMKNPENLKGPVGRKKCRLCRMSRQTTVNGLTMRTLMSMTVWSVPRMKK